jgi:hypothetical protein
LQLAGRTALLSGLVRKCSSSACACLPPCIAVCAALPLLQGHASAWFTASGRGVLTACYCFVSFGSAVLFSLLLLLSAVHRATLVPCMSTCWVRLCINSLLCLLLLLLLLHAGPRWCCVRARAG